MFTKTGKKESEKMIKRKTAETTGKIEREGERRKMRERQNAKSLGAVHTHTHTHTHTHKSLFNGKIWPFKDVMSTKQICWTVWRERAMFR